MVPDIRATDGTLVRTDPAAHTIAPEGRYQVERDLLALLVPIDRVRPHPKNPRQGDVGSISLSLEQFAQYKPIVAQRGTGYILAGNHTYQAAVMLGWTHLAVVLKDCDDPTALALMLADNRTSDLGVYDDALLLELAESLPEDLLTATGYDYDVLDDLAKSLGREAVPQAAEYPTLDEKAERFLNSSIRMLNLHFPGDQFEDFVARLQAYMDSQEIETNTDAVIALLGYWEAMQGEDRPGGEE